MCVCVCVCLSWLAKHCTTKRLHVISTCYVTAIFSNSQVKGEGFESDHHVDCVWVNSVSAIFWHVATVFISTVVHPLKLWLLQPQFKWEISVGAFLSLFPTDSACYDAAFFPFFWRGTMTNPPWGLVSRLLGTSVWQMGLQLLSTPLNRSLIWKRKVFIYLSCLSVSLWTIAEHNVWKEKLHL